ncbi:hypothetical protein Tco_0237896 [Tanacetum coccineum]
MDEWSKSQNISSEQVERNKPQPPPQAHTEHVNALFTGSEKSDYSPKIQKDPPPSIIVNNKIKKDRPIKTSKKGYHVVELGVMVGILHLETYITCGRIHMLGASFRTISFIIQPSTYEHQEISILRIMLYLSVEELSLHKKNKECNGITQG